MVEAPKFCCKKPRIELRGEGKKGNAVNEVCGHVVPSPLAFDAVKKTDIWKPLLNVKCKGVDGMAVRWLHSTPPGRAELCPPGTTPVGGAGYASWACDGLTTKEAQLHCCNVKGRMVCVRRFTDATSGNACDCSSGGIPRSEPPRAGAKPPAEAAAGLGALALSLAPAARRG